MAVTAADGSRHHSATRARMHDERNAKPKPAMEEKEPKKPTEGEDSGDIKDVVAKHGPAHEMHYKHDEATGKHHVHSKHGGHDHHSEHESSEDAHKHMAKAMGHDEEGEENEPEDETLREEAGEMMPEAQSHSRIPGLG